MPSDCKKPSKPEMHKFFSVMEGCKKHTIDHQWMKNKLNWDLYTHHEAESFDLSTPYPERIRLSHEWKAYTQKNDIWLSFYEWKKKQESIDVQMANVESSSTKHSCTATDGSKIETSTTFPPYKDIVLGEAQKNSKAIPLVLKDDGAFGIDGRIEKYNEQVNSINTVVKAIEMSCEKYIEVKEGFDNIQVFVNSINRTLNDVNYSTTVLKGFVKESLTRIEDV